ncbi:Tetrathionate reductase subunit A [Dissulfuribacter thermophilus]|uniref:Tetrathionate reductase subunit A n=1 Tax=Dissulfuribacter thermophilus TaxID=1156395 RepID=A0A1B9F946_9BACT|nr:molybdopterin dinucleotide binding domain-containing protein [Dissulfuribacter thermophilus]OCC16394.1 Tetrathionate reductase subunit A [Dissulfuribacter thermophilus]
MKVSRRNLLKGIGAAGALGVFSAGYKGPLQYITRGWWAGERPRNALSGNAPEPEFRVDSKTGKVIVNPDQYVANTVCVGCTSLCGVRVRVDKKTGRVLRVTGNPYHVLAASPALPYETPIIESYLSISRYRNSGLRYRATACGRGNAVLDKLYDPYRIRTPLKRVGPRGSGRWKPISFEQLVREVVEGGDLFGEGQVDGLRAIRDLENPIDPEAPELGPRANQLAFIAGFHEGRLPLAKRFIMSSFGSINFTEHGGNCGLSMRTGYAALLGDWDKYPHLKPDFRNTRFLLSIGTAPANAGNPFQHQGKLVAEGRSDGDLTYVVVDPVLTNTNSLTTGKRSRWIPINPGTDGALVMGMIRWILEKRRYNAAFLSQPGARAAENAGEASWSNATHLVVGDPTDEDYGRFLPAHRLGLADANRHDVFTVIDKASGRPVAHDNASSPAVLFYKGTVVDMSGRSVAVKSSLQLLLEEAQRHSLDEYSAACGTPVETIIGLAEEFTSYGRHAVADCHGGTMHSNGFYTAYAIVMLNALIGNLNWKGGTSVGGGRYAAVSRGPRYNMVDFPGKVKARGVRISRRGFRYEDTTEFKRKKREGRSPYPAEAPWYPLSHSLQSEYIPSALNAYPYSIKAIIFWNTNPLYGQAGLYDRCKKDLADPKKVPLIISIDPFINETSAFADYIVPDTVLYETWGDTGPWGGYLTRANSVRWPAIDPSVDKTPAGDPICMESFLIAVAKRMNLPGFGDSVISDANGDLYPLNHPEDWHLRVAANIAFDAEPVPDAPDEELIMTGVDRIWDKIKAVLKPEERRKVAYVLARGGRFEGEDHAYDGDWLTHRYDKPVQIYNEKLGTSRNSLTGKRFIGTPTWIPPVFADETPLESVYKPEEWPFKTVSTKSQLMSSGVIGTPKLEEIHPNNAIIIHVDDAMDLGIRSGDRVRLTSPGGSVEGIASVRRGIQRGAIGIEHGYGHWGLGARKEQIGNKVWRGSGLRAAGVANNRLGISDPVRKGISTLGDFVIGSNARQGIPVKVEKV